MTSCSVQFAFGHNQPESQLNKSLMMKRTEMPQYDSLDRDWKQAQWFLSAPSPTPCVHLGLCCTRKEGGPEPPEEARGQTDGRRQWWESRQLQPSRAGPPASRAAEDKSAQQVHPEMTSCSGSRRGCKTDRMTREGDHCSTRAPAKFILYLNQ